MSEGKKCPFARLWIFFCIQFDQYLKKKKGGKQVKLEKSNFKQKDKNNVGK